MLQTTYITYFLSIFKQGVYWVTLVLGEEDGPLNRLLHFLHLQTLHKAVQQLQVRRLTGKKHR